MPIDPRTPFIRWRGRPRWFVPVPEYSYQGLSAPRFNVTDQLRRRREAGGEPSLSNEIKIRRRIFHGAAKLPLILEVMDMSRKVFLPTAQNSFHL